MRRISILTLLLFLALSAAGTQDASAYTASYRQTMTGPDDIAMTYDVRLKDGKMRMDIEFEGERRVFLLKEDAAYTYFPATNVYIKMPDAARAPEINRNPVEFARHVKSMGAENLGVETEGIYTCDVYRYRDEESGSIVTAWIWQGKDFPAKISFSGGLIESMVIFRDIKLDEPISDEVFDVPKDAQQYNPNSLSAMFNSMVEAQEAEQDQIMNILQ